MAGSNFVDYVKIFARSGHGGSGSAHFRREKFVEFGGPDGGDGGRGGHIILRGDSQYWTLIHLKYQRHQFAEDGEGGSGARSSGKNGKDIVIPVPLGTVARRVLEDGTTEYAGEVTADGEELVLLKGGRGGLGYWHFKTSTNQAPRYAQPGEDRQEGTFILELKVLADVGLVGFPNAGKSTLLSVVSAAKPKIANYAFTTLEPNLGIVECRDHHSFVMADIPGIIEGAHEGKGLGTRFLRHIERNSVLLFMIPADSDDIRRDLSYMTYAPILFISAATGQRVPRLFEMINYVHNQSCMRISTGMLNNILADAQTRVQPPTDRGRRLKIYYMTQVGVCPPHFVVFCNERKLFHFSYQRYLENCIRNVFGLEGTPVIMSIREKGDKED